MKPQFSSGLSLSARVKLIGAAVAVVLFIVGSFLSYHSTDSNEVGVRTRKWTLFGQIGTETNVYAPGSTFFFLPVLNDWDTFNTRIQVVEMKKASLRGGNEELAFKTTEGNDLHLDIRFAYRIDPTRAAYIRQFVAATDEEVREKVFKTLVRSRTRDFFGELTTQHFYNADDRNAATERAKQGLQAILKEYGIILESISLMDYRFNDAYAKVIEQKKLAEQNRSQVEARIIAQREGNTKLLNEAEGSVNALVAQADALYTNTVAAAEAYFDQQRIIAEATTVEGRNKADTIRKTREAMASAGGETQIKMKLAESLKGKRIIMIPAMSGGLNVNNFDVNKFLELYGLRRLGTEGR